MKNVIAFTVFTVSNQNYLTANDASKKMYIEKC